MSEANQRPKREKKRYLTQEEIRRDDEFWANHFGAFNDSSEEDDDYVAQDECLLESDEYDSDFYEDFKPRRKRKQDKQQEKHSINSGSAGYEGKGSKKSPQHQDDDDDQSDNSRQSSSSQADDKSSSSNSVVEIQVNKNVNKPNMTQQQIFYMENIKNYPYIRNAHFVVDINTLEKVDKSYFKFNDSYHYSAPPEDQPFLNRNIMGIGHRLQSDFEEQSKPDSHHTLVKIEDERYKFDAELLKIYNALKLLSAALIAVEQGVAQELINQKYIQKINQTLLLEQYNNLKNCSLPHLTEFKEKLNKRQEFLQEQKKVFICKWNKMDKIHYVPSLDFKLNKLKDESKKTYNFQQYIQLFWKQYSLVHSKTNQLEYFSFMDLEQQKDKSQINVLQDFIMHQQQQFTQEQQSSQQQLQPAFIFLIENKQALQITMQLIYEIIQSSPDDNLLKDKYTEVFILIVEKLFGMPFSAFNKNASNINQDNIEHFIQLLKGLQLNQKKANNCLNLPKFGENASNQALLQQLQETKQKEDTRFLDEQKYFPIFPQNSSNIIFGKLFLYLVISFMFSLYEKINYLLYTLKLAQSDLILLNNPLFLKCSQEVSSVSLQQAIIEVLKKIARYKLDETIFERIMKCFGEEHQFKLLNIRTLMQHCKKSIENYFCDGFSYDFHIAWENSQGNYANTLKQTIHSIDQSLTINDPKDFVISRISYDQNSNQIYIHQLMFNQLKVPEEIVIDDSSDEECKKNSATNDNNKKIKCKCKPKYQNSQKVIIQIDSDDDQGKCEDATNKKDATDSAQPQDKELMNNSSNNNLNNNFQVLLEQQDNEGDEQLGDVIQKKLKK